MKGNEMKLVAYMQGSNKRFVIPVYQRNYDWKIENCKQLFDDLVKVIRNGRKSHFFGSIVSVYNPDGANDEFLVIDGQQRLTTVSLLLLAMYNLLEKGIVVPAKASLSERIYETYLVDKWQDDDTRIKLKPVKNDRMAFSKLFDDESEHIKESNLTINYNYFHERIQKEEITIDELFDSLSRLEIISITLNQDDNPQLIFESLNSTGVALSEGDKIRNFILMGLPTKEQNDFYEKYWNKIEVCTGYEVSAFIRDYLSVKQQVTPSMNRIYYTFKAYVEDRELETEPLLSDLLSYAKWYEILVKGKTANSALNACIYRLNRLETTVTRPFFLEILRLHSENKLSMDEVTDVFLTTENYLFRRTICDLPTNALNKIFLMLHKDVMRYDGTDDNYVAKLKYALLAKKERARFPDDAEFAESFSTRPMYLMNSKNKIYVLERLENFGTAEDKDVYRHFDDGTYSIEHIMPQHLTPAWVKDLGEDYLTIHEGLYAERNTSTFTKIALLRKLFKLYDVDSSELIFFLRDVNDSTDDEDITGTRYELRRRYWTYALDFIHEAHGDGSFSNVHASKQNWISGFFGVNGFNICCVANYDSARVELYMGNASKDYNKAAYDRLITHRSQIESVLGVSLIWNRGDDIKSCKVSYQIDSVSIENETDWLQMAKFHAEWSKKFYDVIVPYLV